MSNTIFHSPISLREKRKELEQRTTVNNYSPTLFQPVRLSSLLKQIRHLPDEQHSLEAFADQLSGYQVRLLAYHYPYENESKQTMQKITHLVSRRYQREIGRMLWAIYQNYTSHTGLIHLVKLIWKTEKGSFLGIDTEARRLLNQAYQTEVPLEMLADHLTEAEQPAKQILKRWKIKESTECARKLLYLMLRNSIQQDKIFKREGEKTIVKYLARFSYTEYRYCIKRYLQAREYATFHHSIIRQAVEILGDPRTDERKWRFLPDETVLEVKRYLLRDFFTQDPNNERILFWENHLKSMLNVIVITNFHNNPEALIMYFPNFVTVEFAGHGNAAFFYHREGFEKVIYPKIRMKQRKLKKERLSLLKDDRKEPIVRRKKYRLCINRLEHRGENWQELFTKYMTHYLQGDWEYAHEEKEMQGELNFGE